MSPKSATLSFNELRQSIAKRQLAPVYILYGEEGYYIDRLVEDFEGVVPEEERDFNLYLLYGADTTPQTVIDTCRRYPMMADRVVVILKEAQAMRADLVNKLAVYIESPSPSTVLVICFRGEEKPKGKDLVAAMKKGPNVMFESKKLRDYNVAPVIAELVKARGLNIEQKGLAMLRDFIGCDVSRLHNEIDKLAQILGPGAMITPEAIERNIGISKDYNSMELIDALASRNTQKAFRIIAYFKSNPKKCPTRATVSALFNYFSSVIIMQFSPDKSERGLMQAAGLSQPWMLKNYQPALRNYNAFQTMEIMAALRDFDVKSKGIGSRANEFDLFHDLIFHILTAQGKIEI